ncbi:IclR family transcriptional regulator [Paenibacillus sp. Cedars]|uniref:IclR family transcriptional regulator n=1 Tax=Paenibacillus sp. Cedars TaxID=1980674 RepID=UPI0011640646|nr:IclR family transcriptional regulator [Paenibacillus sp. Cedars]AWP28767.1 transcriptional regulator [Paenibacillus sp. Cedars]
MDQLLTSVQKSCKLLKLFLRDQKEWGITELSKELQWSKGAVHKMLATLESEGFIKQNRLTRQYSLGYTCLELGNRVKRNNDWVSVARPYLERIAKLTKESVCLCVREGNEAIYMDKIDSPLPIRFIIDAYRRFPLYATSASRVILAFSPDGVKEQIMIEPLAAFTEHSMKSVKELRERISRIEDQGYEISSNMRNVGVTGIAAPIYDSEGQVNASISLVGPSDRIDQHKEDWIQEVLQAAADISNLVGYHP